MTFNTYDTQLFKDVMLEIPIQVHAFQS